MKQAKLFTDGGARGNPGPAAIAFVICKMDDSVVEKSGKYLGETTNNQAEYQALLAGLSRCLELQAEDVQVFMDSELVVKQLAGLYKVKNQDLKPHYLAIQQLIPKFKSVIFSHVPRAKNKLADAELNRILDKQNRL
jgi:ribonuclease HI